MGARAHLLGCATPHFACVWAFGVLVYVPYFFAFAFPAAFGVRVSFYFYFHFLRHTPHLVLGKGIPEHVMLIALL